MANNYDNLDRNKYLSRIAGTLNQGWFSGESLKKQVIAVILVACIFLLGIGLIVAMLVIEQINNPSDVALFIGALIGCSVGLSIIPIGCLIFFIRNYKKRKNILVWLEDAIEMKAYTKTIGVWKPIFEVCSVRIQVSFNFNEQTYVRESKGKRMGVPEGFHSFWRKYADRTVNILYSPKYDEVMILKN